MRRFLGKTLASAAMVASAAGLFAVPAQAAPTAKAPVASPMYFSYGCDYGRACIQLQAPVADDIWNLEQCGNNTVHDHYTWAMARGNGFTAYYQNGTWDYTAPWTQRSLDKYNVVTSVWVYC